MCKFYDIPSASRRYSLLNCFYLWKFPIILFFGFTRDLNIQIYKIIVILSGKIFTLSKNQMHKFLLYSAPSLLFMTFVCKDFPTPKRNYNDSCKNINYIKTNLNKNYYHIIHYKYKTIIFFKISC